MLDVAFGYPCGEEVLEARIGQLDYDCVVDRGFLCQNNCHYQISIIQNHKTLTPLYSNDCLDWILARLGPELELDKGLLLEACVVWQLLTVSSKSRTSPQILLINVRKLTERNLGI